MHIFTTLNSPLQPVIGAGAYTPHWHAAMMKRQRGRNKQRGFALALVLLLTVVTGALVIGSIQEMTVQERLTGLFQQNLSARHVAEAAIFITYEKLQEQITTIPAGVSFEQLMEYMQNITTEGVTAGGNSYAAELNMTADGIVTITGLGTSDAGVNNTLSAQFQLVAQRIDQSSSISAGVIACVNLQLSDSARLDAWLSGDNRLDYDASLVRPFDGNGYMAKVIGEGGSLSVTGDSTLWGNTFAQHSVNVIGSGVIYGSVETSAGGLTLSSRPTLNNSGNLYLPYHEEDENIAISGDLKLPGNFIYKAGSIFGAVRTNSDLVLSPDVEASSDLMRIHNQRSYRGRENVLYGGSYRPSFSQYPPNLYQYGLSLDSSRFRKNPNIPMVPAAYSFLTNPPPPSFQANFAIDRTCEPVEIEEFMGKYNDAPSPPIEMNSNGMRWQLTPSSATGVGSTTLKPRNVELPTGETMPMFIVERLDVNSDSVIAVSGGNVYLKVVGTMSLTKGATIDIAPGSSLTIYVGGTMTINDAHSKGVGTVGEGEERRAALAIYSINTSMMYIAGNTNMYALFYLPRKTVFITDDAQLRGTVRANSLYLEQRARVSFDEQMSSIMDVPSPGDNYRLEFLGFIF